MRTLWIASGVFLLGAVACVVQGRDQLSLLLATVGFELAYAADSNIDWKTPITRSNWSEVVFARRWQVRMVGQVAQWLAFASLAGFFFLVYR